MYTSFKSLYILPLAVNYQKQTYLILYLVPSITQGSIENVH